eukprot:SAG31_NODE_311_length_17866_cov_7.010750_3_plen_148_part_00
MSARKAFHERQAIGGVAASPCASKPERRRIMAQVEAAASQRAPAQRSSATVKCIVIADTQIHGAERARCARSSRVGSGRGSRRVGSQPARPARAASRRVTSRGRGMPRTVSRGGQKQKGRHAREHARNIIARGVRCRAPQAQLTSSC